MVNCVFYLLSIFWYFFTTAKEIIVYYNFHTSGTRLYITGQINWLGKYLSIEDSFDIDCTRVSTQLCFPGHTPAITIMNEIVQKVIKL